MGLKITYSMCLAVSLLLFFGFFLIIHGQAGESLTNVCLRCICEATSNCNQTKACTLKNACGIFRITWAYWHDGGQQTVNNESPLSISAFENCANDPFCAVKTVQNYMNIYAQDCNGDNQIDCYDFAAIHKQGGYGCTKGISGDYADTLNECLQYYGAN